MSPCDMSQTYLHIVLAVMGGLNTLLISYLTWREKQESRKRRRFHSDMRDANGIEGDEGPMTQARIDRSCGP